MVLNVRNEGDLLIDLGSKNGVALNRLRISSPRMLQDGDHVMAGNCEFHYRSARQEFGAPHAREDTGATTMLDPLDAPVTTHGTILLSHSGETRWMSQTAHHWVGAYFEGPEEFRSWVAPMLSNRSQVSVTRQRADRQLAASLTEKTQDYLLVELSEEEALTAELLQTRLGLTPRLAEALFWIVGGKSNSEIGTILGISERTVEKHVELLFEKIDVENRNAAVRKVMDMLGRPIASS